MSSKLFSPFDMRGMTIDNRAIVSPMCEYSAVGGCGLVITEAAAVEPRGRRARRRNQLTAAI